MVLPRRHFLLHVVKGLIVSMILASVFTVATATPAETPVGNQPYPTLVAHRGGGIMYPESTLQAFRTAHLVNPTAMIEFDVWALKDGTLVVNHDRTVDRTAANGVTGNVADMTLAQWRKLRITDPQGGPPAPAATLQDVLDEFGGTDLVLVPEIKDADRVDEFIEAVWPHRGQVVVQSLKRVVVERLAKTGLHVLQVTGVPETVDVVPGIYAICMKETKVTPAVIDRMRAHDVKLWSYTINDQERASELIDMGIEGVMTDNPTLEAVRTA